MFASILICSTRKINNTALKYNKTNGLSLICLNYGAFYLKKKKKKNPSKFGMHHQHTSHDRTSFLSKISCNNMIHFYEQYFLTSWNHIFPTSILSFLTFIVWTQPCICRGRCCSTKHCNICDWVLHCRTWWSQFRWPTSRKDFVKKRY